MLNVLANPALWASLGAFLAAVGIEVNHQTTTHILEILAAIAGILGIASAIRVEARKTL